jgi:hypothetical protein
VSGWGQAGAEGIAFPNRGYASSRKRGQVLQGIIHHIGPVPRVPPSPFLTETTIEDVETIPVIQEEVAGKGLS